MIPLVVGAFGEVNEELEKVLKRVAKAAAAETDDSQFHLWATRKVTLATKSLLFECLVPERVGHAVGTGSTSRVQIRSQPRLKSRKGFFCVSTQGGFWEISYVRHKLE